MSNKNIALILSGAGHLDGAEITEAVSLLIAFSDAGYHIDFFAPNRDQADVVDHIKGKPDGTIRNIMTEAARIARGKIQPVETIDVTQYAAIALAGGFGVVKNLTNFLEAGDNGKLRDDVAKPMHAALKNKTPIVAICAAPLAVAMAVHEMKITDAEFTFGLRANATDFLASCDKWGIKHIDTTVDSCHLDPKNRLITSGAYMYGDAKPNEIFACAKACVNALKKL